MEGGIRGMEQILTAPNRPTAVMCSNDMTAVGVLHQAYKSGLRIPQDLSVIGFDDIQLARVVIPPLTSIQMSRTSLATSAVNALRAHTEATSPRREYPIETQLVVRESTTFPPGSMDYLEQKSARRAPRAEANGK
jgi:LacI family transcriptional regulator